MANNFYEQFFDAQKSMFNTWNNYLNPMKETEKEVVKGEGFNPMNYFTEMGELNQKLMGSFYTNPMDAFKEFSQSGPFAMGNFMKSDEIGNVWKNIMAFNQMLFNQNFENPQDLWQSMNTNFDNYISAYQLWKTLAKRDKLDLDAVEDIYNNWRNQYSNYMKTYFIPSMAEGMQDPMNKYIDSTNSYMDTLGELARPMLNNTNDMTNLFLKSLKNGPQEYFEYMKEFGENLNDSFNKYLNSPFTIDDEAFKATQQKLVDGMTNYNTSLNLYYSKLNEIFKGASKDGIEKYISLVNEGLKPKTFEEFYKFWTDKRNEFVENAFLSEDFKGVVEGTLAAMTNFKEENEEILREYYSFLQIPKKSDIDKLIEKVDEMSKELAEVKKLIKK